MQARLRLKSRLAQNGKKEAREAAVAVTLVDVDVVPVNEADVGHRWFARHVRAHATMN